MLLFFFKKVERHLPVYGWVFGSRVHSIIYQERTSKSCCQKEDLLKHSSSSVTSLFLFCSCYVYRQSELFKTFPNSELLSSPHISKSRETLFASVNLVFTSFLLFQFFLSYLFKIKVMNSGDGNQNQGYAVGLFYMTMDFAMDNHQSMQNG